MSSSGQKYVGRNRPPRVQITYDVEKEGASQSVEIPMVVGVLSDLSGDNTAVRGSVRSREFRTIDAETFEAEMAQINPSVNLRVRDTLSGGDAELGVSLSFRKMSHFSPIELVKQVPALRQLYEIRQRLSHLLAYMDGKVGAETLVNEVMRDPSILNDQARLENLMQKFEK